jgi:galactose mutarotase-like enzyme
MITTLSNANISIKVNSLGAELWSLQQVGERYEYLWQGDEAYWASRSPVLFPIVGSVKNSEMMVDGIKYSLSNHGFSRKSEFELVEKTDISLIYSLKYNEETLSMYPFKFELQLIYALRDYSVSISYIVKNLDTKEIFFQLGTHPGFNCPMDNATKLNDYYIEFESTENAKRLFVDENQMVVSDKEEEGLNSNVFKLEASKFYEGACIYRNLRSQSLTLKSDICDRFVKLDYTNFPYLGIWQKPDAPFICLEPWHGISDSDNFHGEFKDKEMMIALDIDQEYPCELIISI